MQIKISTLVENTNLADNNLESANALSFLVEYDGQKILFDTGGRQGVFLNNADKLNLNISDVDYMVLSHGHYDHTGGVLHYIKKYGTKFKLIVNPTVFYKRYVFKENEKTYIGTPFTEEQLIDLNVNLFYIYDTYEITKNIFAVTGFEVNPEYPREQTGLFYEENGTLLNDDMPGEVILVLKHEKGLVIIIGCSHVGVVSIVEKVKSLFDEEIYAIFGGTHLKNSTPELIEKTVKYFGDSDIKKIGACHCTGEKGEEMFASILGDRFFKISTGTIIDI